MSTITHIHLFSLLKAHTQTHTHTHTDTHTQTHTHRHTQTHTDRRTHTPSLAMEVLHNVTLAHETMRQHKQTVSYFEHGAELCSALPACVCVCEPVVCVCV